MSIYTFYLKPLFTEEEYLTITKEHRNKIRSFCRYFYSEEEFKRIFTTVRAYDVILHLLQSYEATENEINAVLKARQRVQDMIDHNSKYRRVVSSHHPCRR